MADRFQIHLFTAERPLEGEAATLSGLFAAGLDYLHIRRPDFNADCAETLIRQLPECYHRRLVLHDHYALAEKYGCGVQLNGRNGGSDRALARSCHSLAEIERNRGLEFLTLSPVFDSISKVSYSARFSREELMTADLRDVVALGGITIDSLAEVRAMGFGGAALLGDVWHRPDGSVRLLKYLHFRNFGLQFITDGACIEETVDQARTVLDAGCRWVQVRMKNADCGEVRETLEELLPRCREVGATLIVDDRYELTDLCHGVHLGQTDAPVVEVIKLIPSEKIIGLTVNNSEQIRTSLSALPDYYGVGPYRFTSTKKNLAPVLGLDGYKKLASELKRPFVAIGGIRLDDIPALMQAGAGGIAVSSLITRAADPEETTKNLIHIIYGK